MGDELEIVILGTADESSEPVAPSPGSGDRAWLPLALLGLVVLAVFGLALISRGESSGPALVEEPAAAPSSTVAESIAADAFEPARALESADERHSIQNSIHPARSSDGRESLVVSFDDSDVVWVIGLNSGITTEWTAPEPLAGEDTVSVGSSIVAVGDSRVWARDLEDGSEWIDLGAADVARHSSNPDRVWLRSTDETITPFGPEARWNEVDLEGTIHQTMLRDRTLRFETPELWQTPNGIFQFTGVGGNPWRIVSRYGTPIAIGVNDIVSLECSDRGRLCGRVWLDANEGEHQPRIYTDLADSIEVDRLAKLSPDGRFVLDETNSGGVRIESVVGDESIPNACLWDGSIAWTSSSEFVACAVEDEVLIYSSETGEAIGLTVPTPDQPNAQVAFVPAP